jgi:hypothetical protein
MTITNTGLYKTSGVCAAIGGAIYALVQIKHPSATVAHLQGTDLQVRMYFKIAFTALALAGFAGMFLASRRRFSLLGAVGYVLLSIGFLAMFAVECIVGVVMPTASKTNATYVQHVLNGAMGHGTATGIGHLQQLFLTAGIGYALGGLLFGIALFRAGVLARWAAALLAAGCVATLALSKLPESFDRPFAVPVGIALIGLGVSLYRNQHSTINLVDESPARTEPVAV